MDRPTFFAFYPADFANDINVEAMSPLQVGAYMLLLCKAWQADPPASLPNDDQVLARLARVTPEVWAEIRSGVLSAFRVLADGRLHSKRLRKEYDAALSRMKKQSEAAKKAADARWSGAGRVQSADASRMRDAFTTHCDRNATQTETEEVNPRTQEGGSPTRPPRIADVIDYWNSRAKLPKVKARSPGWSRFLMQLAEIDGFCDGGWQAAIDNLAASPYHRGENDNGWTATLDWLLKPDNYVKAANLVTAAPRDQPIKITTVDELNAADMKMAPPKRLILPGSHHVG